MIVTGSKIMFTFRNVGFACKDPSDQYTWGKHLDPANTTYKAMQIFNTTLHIVIYAHAEI